MEIVSQLLIIIKITRINNIFHARTLPLYKIGACFQFGEYFDPFLASDTAKCVCLSVKPAFLSSTISSSSVQYFCNSLTPGRYNPCQVLADSRSHLQPSMSLALTLQFLTPSLSASLITPSIHLRFDLPTRLLPSGLSKMIFLHGRLSCIRTICPAHLSLIVVTKSISSYRQYSS